jgi:hypothetical protein
VKVLIVNPRDVWPKATLDRLCAELGADRVVTNVNCRQRQAYVIEQEYYITFPAPVPELVGTIDDVREGWS